MKLPEPIKYKNVKTGEVRELTKVEELERFFDNRSSFEWVNIAHAVSVLPRTPTTSS